MLRSMEIEMCHGILVLHADGTDECEHAEICGCEELLHEWALPCAELSCGCAGEERPLESVVPMPLPLAA
jgi:hypothetical protein